MKVAAILCCLFGLGLCGMVKKCRDDWQLGNGDRSCYKAIDLKTSWAQAWMLCTVMRSNLVDISSQFEQDSLAEIIKRNYSDIYPQFWMDLSDLSTENSWKQMTFNTESTYFNWIPNEMNNYKNSEHCAHINAKPVRNYQWNDHQCQAQLNFICESYPDEVYDEAFVQ